ncbi:tape measure protein [Eubacterium sp.]|uniref:tape measure protein n=1 Tax=Eubacterium sp. TaxID=142586 RepID=UPI002FC81CF6
MADYSVKAVLSAVDKNFSATMKSALGYTDNLKSTLTGGLGFGVMMGIGQQAFSAISSGFSSLTKEAVTSSDSMQKLQQAMRFSGYSEAEINRVAGATGTLKTYADKTVFSLQDVMSTFGALSANGVKDADKLTEAVGNAVAVFGGGAQEFSGVALAFSQAMATGALHAQDWNQIVNASPQLAGGLRKELIKLNPVLEDDFKGAMEQGAITADLLGEAMNNIGMTDMAKEAATSVNTFEGAMGNLEATVSSGVMGIYDSFAKAGIVGAINNMNAGIGAGFDWLNGALPDFISTASLYLESLGNAAMELSGPFKEAFGAVMDSLAELNGSFGSVESVGSFRDSVNGVKDALMGAAGFIKDHADSIARVIDVLPKLLVAYKGFQIVKAIVPFQSAFSKAINDMAAKKIGTIAAKLFGIAAGETAAGTASQTSASQVLKAAVAFLILGAGVLLIAAGIGVLVYSAIQLAQAGPMAAVALLGLVVVVGLFMAAAALLGPALTAGAIGLVAFGIAMLLVGAGALLASLGLAIVAQVLPTITEYGLQGAGAILALGGAMAIFAVGAALAGVACVVLAAGLIVVGVGLLAVGVGAGVASIGMAAMAATSLLLGAGLLITGVAVTVIALALPLIAVGALLATVGLAGMLASSLLLSVALMAMVIPLGLAGAALLVSAAGALAFGFAMTGASAGVLIMAGALVAVNASMGSIADNARSAEQSITSMVGAVDVVNAGLDALGGLAKSTVADIVNAFSSGAGNAQGAAGKLMAGFNNGLRTGGNTAISAAGDISRSVGDRLRSASDGAYSNGYNVGSGLASGMYGSLGEVTAAADALVSEVDRAIRAKAQIHSPARLTQKLGKYLGLGVPKGIESTLGRVKKASQKLVDIPRVPTFSPASPGGASGGQLNQDYNYQPVVYVQAEVTSNMDGRAVGYGAAEYVQEKNDFETKRKNRIGGVVNV